MPRFQIIPASLICTMLAGCAIHPLPEDVTALNTNAVVNHIRCEARDAIISAIGSYLSYQHDDISRQYGIDLLSKKVIFKKEDLPKLNKDARDNINKYLPAAIAYDFTFDITEDNDVSTQVDFIDTFTHSVFSLGAKAENERQRQTIRNFGLSDTFEELVGPVAYCDGLNTGENLVYPITGTIGLAEMIKTFVDLNEFQHLAPGKSSTDKAPLLSDTFNFQTKISGSVAPKITLNPVKLGPRLSDAALGASGYRTDTHKVIVALSLPPAKPVKGGMGVAGLLAAPGVTTTSLAFKKTPAQESATAEIGNQIQRNILSNLVLRANQ